MSVCMAYIKSTFIGLEYDSLESFILSIHWYLIQ